VTSKRIILAGGSGFIGQSLGDHLVGQGYEVLVLSRRPQNYSGPGHAMAWDGKTLGDWAEQVNGAHAIVNLTGKNVNCHHNATNRQLIIDSRVDSVQVLDLAISQCDQPPKVFIQAAGYGVYGDTGDQICDESTAPGEDFLAQTCVQWEQAFNKGQTSESVKTRRVILRIGVVLGIGGGALVPLANLTRLFLGGAAGNGRQYFSWVHIQDINRMVLYAITHERISGAFNAVAPNPVTNTDFMKELRRVMRRPWSPPVPALMVRLGAWMMGSDASLALFSCRCVPKRLTESGFEFQFKDLGAALEDLFSKSDTSNKKEIRT
jgi:uncharacterized protein (TIGR01777 family)